MTKENLMSIEQRLSCILVLGKIEDERKRQHMKWGEQNHTPMEWLPILMEEVGECSKEALDDYFESKKLTLPNTSKRLEAMLRLRAELIQVAAVATAMVESLDRNELITLKPY